jgi:mono/diheme cytochrome c family protein
LAKSDSARLIFALIENLTTADIDLLKKNFSDPGKIKEALDLFEAQSMSMLKDDSFDRCQWIPDLLQLSQTGSSKVAECLANSNAKWPAAQATGVHAVITNSDLKLFFTYCGACHQSGPRNFLAGATEADVNLGLKKNAGEHVQRLNWEAPIAGRSPMPPNNTTQHNLLSQSPGDREKMMNYLKNLK